MKPITCDLFFGCFGNGISVSDRSRYEYGDYKSIAHIADDGKIKWYVTPEKLNEDSRNRIEQAAEEQKCIFETWLNSLTETERKKVLLDRMTDAEFLAYCEKSRK